MRNIDESINHVRGTMAIEGIVLSDEDVARGRAILEGEGNPELMIAEIRAKYAEPTYALKRKAAR
ncbi:MAG: hypothetical protein GKR90_26080 [Pseudomonadales bacterium]|nr:hypothetical protein [Pseudomonadales bacterium]